MMPSYVRGQAYLKTKQSKEATAEFQIILDHRGVCQAAPFCSLSHPQLGRARALSGDTASARIALATAVAPPSAPTQQNMENAYTRRSLKNGRPMASFQATETNLNSLLPWSKDFVQGAGRALSPETLRPGKRNARLVTRQRTRLLSSMPG
jgi:hypothetical protein